MNEAEAKKKLEDAAIGIAIKHMHTREAGGAKAIVDAAVEYAQALLAAARVPVKGLTHHGPTMPHPGPSNQPLACALTADGVPIRTGMRCFDYNLNEVEIVEPYSEGAQPESSVKVRVFVGIVDSDEVEGKNVE